MLEKMTAAWLDLLGDYGWETPTEELTWCTTLDDGDVAQINIASQRTIRAAAKDGFKVLGTIVTFDKKFDVELENRPSRADRAFWANWALLGCTSIPLENGWACSRRL